MARDTWRSGPVCECVCVCARARVCACACVCARARACVRVCVCARVPRFACLSAWGGRGAGGGRVCKGCLAAQARRSAFCIFTAMSSHGNKGGSKVRCDLSLHAHTRACARARPACLRAGVVRARRRARAGLAESETGLAPWAERRVGDRYRGQLESWGQGWPRRAEAPSRASRLAPQAERSASGLARTWHCAHARVFAAVPRRRGRLRRAAAWCRVRVSEQKTAQCSEMDSCAKLFSNGKRRSCKLLG